MKILFLSKSPDATEVYRCAIPQKYLQRAGHDVRRTYVEEQPRKPGSGIKEADVEWADVVVFQRPLTKFALDCLTMIKQKIPGKVLVGDYDDDYFSVPTWNPGYTFVKANQPHWEQMLPLFDGLTVSTNPLKGALMQATQAPIEVIPNGFDFDAFDAARSDVKFGLKASRIKDKAIDHAYAIDNQQFNELMRDRVVVGWAGSRFHYVDQEWLVDSLADICKADERIVFLFIGYIQDRVVKEIPLSRLFTAAGAYPVENFYAMLKSVKIDIALAPLDPCTFNSSKSNLKILEAMSLGAFPVCSRFDPYEEDLDWEAAMVFEDDEFMPRHGLLVDYREIDWKEKILSAAKTVSDPVAKAAMMSANNAYVRARHSAELRTEAYVNFFQSLLNAKVSR